MKTAIHFSIFALIATAAGIACAQTTNLPPPTPYAVVHRDANSEVLQQTFYEKSRSGKAISHTRSITKIETGLNYWDGTKWSDSDPTFQVSADGQYVFADKVQTKVRLSANLAAGNAVSLTTPDGIVLNTTPMAVGLYDAASGNSIIIASITNCSGTLISSNQVLYQNAFNGISGDIVYTLNRGTFSQDIIWKQNIDPADYGFPTNTTRIQILTAFNSPAPKQTARPLRVEQDQALRSQMASPDLIDHTLRFGQLKFGPGRVYATTSKVKVGGAPVAKDFESINGQSYLIESVEYNDIKNDLASLPRVALSAKAKAKMAKMARAGRYVKIPTLHRATKATFAIKSGRNMLATATEPRGVVADYVAISGSQPDPMVFQGDTTYFVSGYVNCDDAVFEGGTVLKYPNDSSPMVEVDGNLTCAGAPYLPIIFTAADDDSVGDSMSGAWSGYTGTIQPGGYADIALSLWGHAGPFVNCRFLYCQVAVLCDFSGPEDFRDVQFVNCTTALYNSLNVSLENCLVAYVTNLVNDSTTEDSSLSLVNCTIDNCMTVMNYSLDDVIYATNSIFSNMGALTNGPAGPGGFEGAYGSNNGFFNNNGNFTFGNNQIVDYTSPYETVLGGNYYLTNGTPFRAAGASPADPVLVADLAQRTTWPPIVYDSVDLSSLGTLSPQALRDTNSAPDLGYHYDSLDYMIAGCDLETNLIATSGTAIGYFVDYDANYMPDSITLNDGGSLSLNGTVTQPCIFAEHTMVQENGNINWFNNTDWASGGVTFNGSGNMSMEPLLTANFSKWASDGHTTVWRDYWASGAASIMNSEFYNGALSEYDMQYLDYTNCLFFRIQNDYWDQDYAVSIVYENCTFFNGCLDYNRYNCDPFCDSGLSTSFWQIENCAFDGTALDWYDTLNGNPANTLIDYNAYNTNNLSWQTYPFPYPPVYGTNEFVGPHDVMTGGYNWQSSWFGNFYLPPDSQLIQAGSTNASVLGLYHFTTQTNQTIDGTNTVDIGYHYVATDQYGNPLDTLWFGIPDYLADPNGALTAWELEYFGYLGLDPNSDPDGSGYTLLYDYMNGIDPNIISFSISFPNPFVTTSDVTGTITVAAGTPDYFAVLVDNTNFPSATWSAYVSSNITVNLGSTPGYHDIWIGLRGLPANATPTWIETTLFLDTVPPAIAITNPVNNVSLNSSRVDITGTFTDVSLQQITVDGVQAFINGTNFEALNVPLSPGTNVITAVAEDLTGETNAASIIVIGLTNDDGSMNDPVQLQATPVAGIAPLPVTFSDQTNMPGTMEQVTYDFNGDGIVDFVTNNVDGLTYTYTTNGQYFPVVTVETTLGWFSSIGAGWNGTLNSTDQPVVINVQGQLTQSTFANITDPVDVKWNGTDLYVLSGSSATITELDTNANVIRSISGIGAAPSGMAVDSAGNVYVAMTGQNQVWKFDPTTGSFIADTNFGNGGYIGTFDGDAGSFPGQFSAPFDVAVSPDDGTISVSDTGNNQIQQFTSNGTFLSNFGSQGNGTGQFNAPQGVTYDSDGLLYVADSGNNRVVLVQLSGVVGTTGGSGSALGQLSGPMNISLGNNEAYVVDAGNSRIEQFTVYSPTPLSIGPSTVGYSVSSGLNNPSAVAAADSLAGEAFYVADTGNNRIVQYILGADNPTWAWTSMKTHIGTNDIIGAMRYFSVITATNYEAAFLSAGKTKTASVMAETGALTPVYVQNGWAEYYFQQTINGKTMTFPVEFVKESGIWKIYEF